jgi:truncated hemoglobin YjbI
MSRSREQILRSMLDTYGRWFPSHVKDKELWATVKRGILELIEKYPSECTKYEGLFDRACRAGSLGNHETLGFVLEEFQTRVIQEENEEHKRRMERALPHISTAGMTEYVAKLAKIQKAFNDGRITRGQMLAAMERAMREEGMPESEIEEIVGGARSVAEKTPGGLDGTVSQGSRRMAETALGALNEVGKPQGGERVEADGR